MPKDSLTVLNQVAGHVAIIATDSSGKVTAFNKGAEVLLGYSMDEVIAKPIPINKFSQLSKQIKAENHESLEGELRHKLGHVIAVKLTASAITDNKNNTNGFLFMATMNKSAGESFEITQLYNPEMFEKIVEIEFSRMQRSQQSLALIKIDVDGYNHYKKIHGIERTQQCLNQIAYTIYSRVKRAGDVLVYMGHDEFMIILPNTDKSGAVSVAEYLRLLIVALELGDTNAGPSGKVTISLGIAHLNPSKDNKATDLIEMANHGLKRAKMDGRNCSRIGDI